MENQAYFKINNNYYDYDSIGKTTKTEKLTLILNENNIKIALEKGYKLPKKSINDYFGKTAIFERKTTDNNIDYRLEIILTAEKSKVYLIA